MAIELELDGLFCDGLFVTATYTPYGGEGTQIHAILSLGEDSAMPESIISNGGVHVLPVERNIRPDFHGRSARQVATVFVKVSDIEFPAYRDTIEIDGVIWTVKEVFDNV